MNYIKEYFTRMSLQQFRGFLLTGTQQDSNPRPYEQRLKEDSQLLYDRMKRLYPDEKEYSKAANDIADAITAYEDVFLEIGMKAGARLLLNLLFEDDI
ncbi:MAG: hypothetical protein FWD71_09935 [Oscillospiraceae bacterium]|nr:hypothetical protein [Oscillospiraceae bacterium]